MQRPYIICHMVTSLDGKVTGDFLYTKECEKATEVYYEINRNTKSNGFICGRTTMEESFTNGHYPELSGYNQVDEMEDFVPGNLTGFYAIAFDTYGKLGWKSDKIIDEDPGYGGAQIIEVLSKQADERYLAYLRELNIGYIFAGEKEIDVELALFKLKNTFGINTLLLEGGSMINASFQKADLIDELSLVVAPIVADKESKPLFYDSVISNYKLINSNTQDGALVLNYKRK